MLLLCILNLKLFKKKYKKNKHTKTKCYLFFLVLDVEKVKFYFRIFMLYTFAKSKESQKFVMTFVITEVLNINDISRFEFN